MFVVFDLDGTLADLGRRLHLVRGDGKQDWKLFHELSMEDRPIKEIISVYNAMERDHYIEVWSGRKESSRTRTEAWLEAHGVVPVELRMRPDEDNQRDETLKESWLLQFGAPDLVFEDRSRLVAMWRQHGVRCCQVAHGDY